MTTGCVIGGALLAAQIVLQAQWCSQLTCLLCRENRNWQRGETSGILADPSLPQSISGIILLLLLEMIFSSYFYFALTIFIDRKGVLALKLTLRGKGVFLLRPFFFTLEYNMDQFKAARESFEKYLGFAHRTQEGGQ